MPGPPRTPTRSRKLRGNPGKRAYDKREPKQLPGAPDMPEGLDATATLEWHRLVAATSANQTLSATDRAILELAAKAYSTWMAAEKRLAKEGLTFTTRTTTGAKTIKAHPAVHIASDAWRRYRAAICELGLTPAARTKVQTLAPTEAEDPAETYFDA